MSPELPVAVIWIPTCILFLIHPTPSPLGPGLQPATDTHSPLSRLPKLLVWASYPPVLSKLLYMSQNERARGGEAEEDRNSSRGKSKRRKTLSHWVEPLEGPR